MSVSIFIYTNARFGKELDLNIVICIVKLRKTLIVIYRSNKYRGIASSVFIEQLYAVLKIIFYVKSRSYGSVAVVCRAPQSKPLPGVYVICNNAHLRRRIRKRTKSVNLAHGFNIIVHGVQTRNYIHRLIYRRVLRQFNSLPVFILSI